MSSRSTKAGQAGGGSELRRELIEHARRLIEESGSSEPSLRQVARAAGVSEAAPYRHFEAGVTELMAAVATEGFGELVATMKAAGTTPSRSAVSDVAVAYVRFGVEQAALYRVMFHGQLIEPLEKVMRGELRRGDPGHATFDALLAGRLEAFGVVTELFEGLESAGELPRVDAREAGFILASLGHGLVGSYNDEGLGRRSPTEAPWNEVREQGTRKAFDVLLDGMLGETD